MTRDPNKYAEDYLAECSFENYMVKYRRQLILERLSRLSPSTILEIGCGMEPLFLHMNDSHNFIIIEPAKMFASNAATAANHRTNVRIVARTFEDSIPDIENQHFDVIVASGIIHEVDDPKTFLKLIRRICDKDTIVHFNVPNAYSIHRQIGHQMGKLSNMFALSDRGQSLQQRTVFDSTSFREMLKSADFDIVEQGGYFLKPFTHSQMSELLLQRIMDNSVLDALFEVGRRYPELAAEIFATVKPTLSISA